MYKEKKYFIITQSVNSVPADHKQDNNGMFTTPCPCGGFGAILDMKSWVMMHGCRASVHVLITERSSLPRAWAPAKKQGNGGEAFSNQVKKW